ncbi:MAG TPA: hypothetical protein VHK65_10815 [Candidatus Dormibacteraeota bacterium]|nr:hypothetical protein [Candidatus Dormibacteraeota bacterium]
MPAATDDTRHRVLVDLVGGHEENRIPEGHRLPVEEAEEVVEAGVRDEAADPDGEGNLQDLTFPMGPKAPRRLDLEGNRREMPAAVGLHVAMFVVTGRIIALDLAVGRQH